MAGPGECDDEPLGSGAAELVNIKEEAICMCILRLKKKILL